jgi:hypothetical protein
MRELDELRCWVEVVRKRNQWPHFSEWTNHQFQILSDEISEKTGIKIDRNTIRKIIESVNEEKPYSPHISTKDALAFYIGKKNWLHFKKTLLNSDSKSKRPLWLLLTAVVVLCAITAFFIIRNVEANKQFDFSVVNPEGVLPHTIVCNYDIVNLKTDNIYIDYGQINPDGNYSLLKLNKNSSINKFCFHYPGDYKIRLFIDDEVVASEKVWVNSNGWFVYAIDAASYISRNKLPELIVGAGSPFLQYIPFNTILETQTTDEGYFHIPEEKIMSIKGQTINYHLHLKNFRNFGVDMRNANFDIRFKDSAFGEGVNCSEVAFYLHCEKGQIGFKFAQKGCERYTHQRIGEKFIAGNEADLDYLILDYKQFRTISIKGTPDEIVLLLDDKVLKVFNDQQQFGEIRGMHFWFKGAPDIDFVRLFNEDGVAVFSEEFDSN